MKSPGTSELTELGCHVTVGRQRDETARDCIRTSQSLISFLAGTVLSIQGKYPGIGTNLAVTFSSLPPNYPPPPLRLPQLQCPECKASILGPAVTYEYMIM